MLELGLHGHYQEYVKVQTNKDSVLNNINIRAGQHTPQDSLLGNGTVLSNGPNHFTDNSSYGLDQTNCLADETGRQYIIMIMDSKETLKATLEEFLRAYT